MQQSQNIIFKIYRQMGSIMNDYSFSQILKIYKLKSKELVLFMKRFKSNISHSQKLSNCLYQCLKLISSFINSLEHTKYGHKIPLLAYVVKKYQKQYFQKVQQYQQLTNKRILKNEKQQNFSKIYKQINTPCQWSYLKSSNLLTNTLSIANSQIKIHDAQCVCCSQVFIKGFQIKNQNPCYPVLVGLTEKQNSDLLLQRYICAVSNSGGGVIIIGVQKKNNIILASGIKYKDQYQISQEYKRITKSLSVIKPLYYYNIQQVIVQTNFIQSINNQNEISDQFMRCCYRISIFPYDITRKSYLQIINKGYTNIYQTYQLDSMNKPYKILANKIQKQETIVTSYSLIMEYYYKNKKNLNTNTNKNINININMYRLNNHYIINCKKPLLEYSKIFYQYYQNQNQAKQMEIRKNQQIDNNNNNYNTNTNNNNNTNSNTSNSNYYQKQHQQNDYQNDEPNFKYINSSLLTAGSKKKQKFIKDFSIYLKNKKILHELQKPFPNSFKDSPRPLWILSHQDNLIIIKQALKQFDKNDNITLIPIYKTLQIQRIRLTYQKQQCLYRKFMSRYPQGYFQQQLEIQTQYQPVRQVFFNFNSYIHAVFGFMIFQSLQLRPYFVKENTSYKKKPKITSE